MARKKAWRRIDVSAVQDTLFETNIEKDVRNAALSDDIVIDTEGHAPSRALARKLQSPKYVGPLAKRGQVERTKLQRLVKKLKEEKNRIDIDEYVVPEQASAHDIWGDRNEKRVKRRPKDSNLYKAIPAVLAPHPGQSYNPDPDDHAKLMAQIAEVLPKKQLQSDEPMTELIKDAIPNLELENLSFRKRQKLACLITQNKIDEDSVTQILQEESDSEREIEDEEMETEASRRTRKLKRKTKAQRNRQTAHKLQINKEALRKRVQLVIKEVDRMKKTPVEMKKALRKEKNFDPDAFKDILRKMIDGKAEALKGVQLCDISADVALPDEIPPNVRSIAPLLKTPVENVADSIYTRKLLPRPPTMNKKYRDLVRNRVIRKTRKYKSNLVKGI